MAPDDGFYPADPTVTIRSCCVSTFRAASPPPATKP